VLTGSAHLELALADGDVEAADSTYREVVAAVTALWQQPTFLAQVRLAALLLGGLAHAAGRRSSGELPDLADRGEQVTQDVAAALATRTSSGMWLGPEGTAWAGRAHAEVLRLRWQTASNAPDADMLIGAWEENVEQFTAFGHVFETARSQARLAGVLRSLGHPGRAKDLVVLARRTAGDLGAEPLLTELRTLGPGGRRERSASTASTQLTPREAEVLTLLAQGRTNRQIATQLFISAKTVSVHVSNILAKLDAGGRTEAVAIARRRGLLTD
jgi:DNA-binding CsgD family transcriptional regulator